MTRNQTVEIIGLLQTNYPDVYRNMSDDALAATVNLWARMFTDEPYEIVAAAVMGYIANNTARFAPNIGQVKEAIRKLTHQDELTEGEAWAMVSRALRRSTYDSQEEFAALPPIVQKAVGSPAQLREWAGMDADTVQSVVASNFQRTYRTMLARAAEQEKTPERIRAYFSGLTQPMPEALPDPAPAQVPAIEAPPVTGDALRERIAGLRVAAGEVVITDEKKAAALEKLRNYGKE